MSGWCGCASDWCGCASDWCGCVSDWRGCVRTGTAVFGLAQLRVRKGENGASLQAVIRGLSPFSNSTNLSHLGFCENIACRPHHCSCIGTLDSVISGPIVAFSADLFCRFLLSSAFAGTSDWVSAERFCEGLWPGFGSGHFCEGLLQGILWDFSHDLLRRLAVDVPQRKSRVCVWARVSSCNENLVLASGAGHRLATKLRVCCRVNIRPVLNDGVSRSRPRRPAVSRVKWPAATISHRSLRPRRERLS